VIHAKEELVLYDFATVHPVTGFFTRNWYWYDPEPPVAVTLKVTLVPTILGEAGDTEVKDTPVAADTTFTVIGADNFVAPELS
jgi:hypothetical protein